MKSNCTVGEPRVANDSLTNQTYRTYEGAELNITVTFVTIPGPFMAWYHLSNTKRYVHYTEGRGAGYSKTYHTTTYRIPYVTRYTFGTYFVDADYSNENPDSRAYIRVERDPSCKDSSKLCTFIVYAFEIAMSDSFCKNSTS